MTDINAIKDEVEQGLRPIEQVAIYFPGSPEFALPTLAMLGADEWVQDRVTATGTVFGEKMTNVADLFFNYQIIPGVELEFLHYVSGPNWHSARETSPSQPHLSHLGYHVEDLEEESDRLVDFLGAMPKVAQQVTTVHHSNRALQKSGKTFRYTVWDTLWTLGFDLKWIERILPTDS